MRRLGVAGLALALGLAVAGCGHRAAARAPEPVVTIKEVLVPVARACVPGDLPAAPAYPDTDAALRAAAEGPERYALVAAGRLLREARLAVLEPLVDACRRPPAAPGTAAPP